MRYIHVNLQESSVGMGWRFFLVTKEGNRWSELLHVATAQKVKVPVEALERAVSVPMDKRKAKQVASRLKHTLKERKDWGFRVSESLTRQALLSLSVIAKGGARNI